MVVTFSQLEVRVQRCKLFFFFSSGLNMIVVLCEEQLYDDPTEEAYCPSLGEFS